MTKPVSVPTAFTNLQTATGAMIDANFASVLAALNDPVTYNNYLIDSGVAVNAYVVAFSGATAITSYVAGLEITVFTTRSNTGAATISVNGLGAKNIVNQGGTALTNTQIIANAVFVVHYDGVNFEIISPIVASTAATVTAAAQPAITSVGTLTGLVVASGNTQACSVSNNSINTTLAVINSGVGYAIQGTSSTSYGVQGTSSSNVGVNGQSSTSYGVQGTSSSNIGVFGNSTSNVGIYGNSAGNVGVFGIGGAGFLGVKGTTIGTNLYTAATLPTATANLKGARAFVTDNVPAAWGSAIAGGAGNQYPVWCDGAAWYIG